MKKLFVSALMIMLLGGKLLAQDPLASKVVAQLTEAFKNKSIESLKPLLAQRFSVGLYTGDNARKMMEAIIKNYPLDSIQTGALVNEKGKKAITLTWYSKDKDPQESRLWLNENNEWLYVDMFDKLYQLERHGTSRLIAEIPFENENGSIVLKATLNNSKKTLSFIFDTGADGMALSKKTAEELGIVSSRQQNASVVGGVKRVEISDSNTFHLENFEMKNQKIALFEDMGDKHDGIIGNVLARNHILKVDYDRNMIELHSFGDYQYEEEGTTIPILFPSGLPVIPINVKVSEKEVPANFIFDTGAGYYLIAFGPFVKKNLLLTTGFVPWFTAATVSLGHSSTTFTGNFSQVNFGTLGIKNFPGTLKAYVTGDENWNPDGDGSMGIKIISRFNFTLNLAEKIIHFTPNKYYNLPSDFMLGNYYVGFNDKNQIRVNYYTGKEENGQKLPMGTLITSVNKIPVKTLIEKPEQLKKVLALDPGKLMVLTDKNESIKGL